MAQTIKGLASPMPVVQERAQPEVWRLRLALGWTILFGLIVGLFAVSWDIQWHTAVGRDRTLTAPHLFILASVAISGLVALVAVLVETVWTRRNPSLAQNGITFAGIFSGSLGTYLVGYGALTSAIAFPIDQYWHTLYGIDVAIWAPFHIMSLVGTCVSCLGAAYMLADGASLARQRGAKGAARAGYAGVIIAFAVLMGMISFMLLDATRTKGYIVLGSLIINVYPLLFGTLGAFVLVAAKRAVPWRAVATSVALIYAIWGLANFVLIPQLMAFNLYVEQQNLLPHAPTISVVGFVWQYSLLIAAVLLDGVVWFMRRRGWSLRRVSQGALGAILIGMSLASLSYPSFLASAQSAAPRFHSNTVVIIAVSLMVGLLGIYVGRWLGAVVGESMRRKAA